MTREIWNEHKIVINELLDLGKEAGKLREEWEELHKDPEEFKMTVVSSEEERRELERKSKEFKEKRDALAKSMDKITEKMRGKSDELRNLSKELTK